MTAAGAALLQIGRWRTTMEHEAQEPLYDRLVPFPVAVAIYSPDAVGALPPKMVWSLLMTFVCFMTHIDLEITPNQSRPCQEVRPRLLVYPCAAPGAKKFPVRETLPDHVLVQRISCKFPQFIGCFEGGIHFSGGSTVKGVDQFMLNSWYLSVISNEARKVIPRNFASGVQTNQSEHFKPELFFPFRTGAPFCAQLNERWR